MAKKSAGILAYRFVNLRMEFLLVHPGGPFWANKDVGAWSIPKGEFADEDPLDAAKREFKEEMGSEISGSFIPLTTIKMQSGKTIYAWAVESDFDVRNLRSNTFEMEWPPKSGKFQSIPEVDMAGWYHLEIATNKINPSQVDFLTEVATLYQ